MAIKLKKKGPSKRLSGKIKKVANQSKKIHWDKYFGKIDFPMDALTFQRKMRDEWAN